MIKIEKNIYDPPARADGERELVMRFWPRGVPKQRVDRWLKELGTESDLIKKWKAGSISWPELRSAYLKGLAGREEFWKPLARETRRRTISLLCSCKDPQRCHRSLLKEFLESHSLK